VDLCIYFPHLGYVKRLTKSVLARFWSAAGLPACLAARALTFSRALMRPLVSCSLTFARSSYSDSKVDARSISVSVISSRGVPGADNGVPESPEVVLEIGGEKMRRPNLSVNLRLLVVGCEPGAGAEVCAGCWICSLRSTVLLAPTRALAASWS